MTSVTNVNELLGSIAASTSGLISKWRASDHEHVGLVPRLDKPVLNMSAQVVNWDAAMGLLKATIIFAPVSVNRADATSGAGA
jgi:hypothetical protein